MRAVQVVRPEGPSGVEVVEVPEPTPAEGQVLVDVHAVGVSFPDLLLSAGQYQLKPEPPFQLGVDFAGVVRQAPGASGLSAGDRVACVLPYGGGADVVALDPESVFPLPDAMSFEQGAALPMNYLTAQFALATRASLQEGETVLVHGAAGGVGTAAIQVAKGYGARVIAVVSTEEKAEVAKAAGADEAVLVDGFLAAVKELTGGVGVDVVLDVVGGDLMTDSLRSLAPLGRLLVVGFTAGAIPEVRVNRLLLNNIDVRGVGWGAYAMVRAGFMRRQWDVLVPMM
ncbi:MAG TPA: NADPH:quinone oxidoreductase family protein, partial [Nocardioidaceae bacterium]|nr:NADPH:quinone oxidoreductase family protein [Nocardioidaceae bacterium]